MQLSPDGENYSIEAWLTTGSFCYEEANCRMILETAEKQCEVEAILDSKIVIRCQTLHSHSVRNSDNQQPHHPLYTAVITIHDVIRWLQIIADNRRQSFKNKTPISFATAICWENNQLEKCDLMLKLSGML